MTAQALAKQHSQRLYFPCTLSRQHWGAAGRKRGAALEPLLRSPVMEAFAAALNDTTYPGQRMETWLGLLRPLVSANDRVCCRNNAATNSPSKKAGQTIDVTLLPTVARHLLHLLRMSAVQHGAMISFTGVYCSVRQKAVG